MSRGCRGAFKMRPILPNPRTSFPLPTSPSDEPVLAL
jgi:hypothetical protein